MLANNHAGPEGATSIGGVLSKNRVIKKVNLQWNNIGNTGIEALCKSLGPHSKVRPLVFPNRYRHNIYYMQYTIVYCIQSYTNYTIICNRHNILVTTYTNKTFQPKLSWASPASCPRSLLPLRQRGEFLPHHCKPAVLCETLQERIGGCCRVGSPVVGPKS